MAELRLESVTKKYDSAVYGAHDITLIGSIDPKKIYSFDAQTEENLI